MKYDGKEIAGTTHKLSRFLPALLWTILVISQLAMTYGFAMLGEPTSAWFWHDLLGLL